MVTTPGEFTSIPGQYGPDRYAAVRESAEAEGIAVDPQGARLGAVLVHATRASYILDLGAGNGYRALHLASALGQTGYIEAVEPDLTISRLAEQHIRNHGLSERIRIRSTGIVASARGTNGPFDLVIMASPGRTFPELFDELLRLVRIGGSILMLGLDQAEAEADHAGVTGFLQRLERDSRFLLTLPASGEWALAVRFN